MIPPTTQRGPVTTLQFDVSAGWEQWILFQSDNHHDAITCNQELEKAHLDEALRRDAWIVQCGDFMDAMQGKFDKRRDYDYLRPELRTERYYDALVEYCADFLRPYAGNILVMADGNHEQAVLKNSNTNLPDRLIAQLNRDTNSGIVHGGYGGWIRLLFEKGGNPCGSVKIRYFHGAGGEAPVTRGVIQTNRQAVYLPDADIVVNGHSHNSYYVPISRERCGGKGNVYFDVQHHVRVPGYNQSYGDGSHGWEVTRGGVPKPIGCAWAKLTFDATRNYLDISIQSDIRGADPVDVATGAYAGRVFDDDQEGY